MKSMTISAVAFLLFIPAGGGLQISKDEGKTWSPSETADLPAFMQIAGAKKSLFAIARNGLYRSKDEGKSWSRIELEGKLHFRDLDVADDGTVYVTESNGVRWSKDDGKTWNEIEFPPKKMGRISISTAPNHLAVLKNELYAVTNHGHKLKYSTDMGKTWKPALKPKGYIGTLKSDGKKIYALADNAGLLTGKGEEWSSSIKGMEGTNVAGCDLAVSGKNMACAVVTEFGRHPIIGMFLSRDAGKTWTPVKDIPKARYPGGGEAAWSLHINGDTLYAASSAGAFAVDMKSGAVRKMSAEPAGAVFVRNGSLLLSPK